MRLLAVNFILLAWLVSAWAIEENTRDKRDLLLLKDLLLSKLFGAEKGNCTKSLPLEPVLIREEGDVKIFNVPGYENVLVKAVPKVPVSAVPEHDAALSLLETYLGTQNPDETLIALRGIKNLLQSGVLLKPVPAVVPRPVNTLIPVLPPPNFPREPFVHQVIPVQQHVAYPFVPKYSYKQIENDGSMTHYSTRNNGDVIVTYTNKPPVQPPPQIMHRLREIYLYGKRPIPVHPVITVPEKRTYPLPLPLPSLPAGPRYSLPLPLPHVPARPTYPLPLPPLPARPTYPLPLPPLPAKPTYPLPVPFPPSHLPDVVVPRPIIYDVPHVPFGHVVVPPIQTVIEPVEARYPSIVEVKHPMFRPALPSIATRIAAVPRQPAAMAGEPVPAPPTYVVDRKTGTNLTAVDFTNWLKPYAPSYISYKDDYEPIYFDIKTGRLRVNVNQFAAVNTVNKPPTAAKVDITKPSASSSDSYSYQQIKQDGSITTYPNGDEDKKPAVVETKLDGSKPSANALKLSNYNSQNTWPFINVNTNNNEPEAQPLTAKETAGTSPSSNYYYKLIRNNGDTTTYTGDIKTNKLITNSQIEDVKKEQGGTEGNRLEKVDRDAGLLPLVPSTYLYEQINYKNPNEGSIMKVENGKTEIIPHDHIRPDGTKYPCVEVHEYQHGPIVPWIHDVPLPNYVYKPSMAAVVSAPSPVTVTHQNINTKPAAQFSYTQLTDHGVYEYNKNVSSNNVAVQTAPIAKPVAVVIEKENGKTEINSHEHVRPDGTKYSCVEVHEYQHSPIVPWIQNAPVPNYVYRPSMAAVVSAASPAIVTHNNVNSKPAAQYSYTQLTDHGVFEYNNNVSSNNVAVQTTSIAKPVSYISEKENGKTEINAHEHVRADGTKYPCVEVHEYQHGSIVPWIQNAPLPNYDYKPSMEAMVSAASPVTVTHNNVNTKPAAQFSYTQLTDHGVYEYNNNVSPSSASAHTASIAKPTAVITETENGKTQIIAHEHVRPDGTKYPCVEVHEYQHGPIVPWIQIAPLPNYDYKPSMEAVVSAASPVTVTHTNVNTKPAAQFSYTQLTDHGVYEYNNNVSPSSASAHTASIAKPTAVITENDKTQRIAHEHVRPDGTKYPCAEVHEYQHGPIVPWIQNAPLPNYDYKPPRAAVVSAASPVTVTHTNVNTKPAAQFSYTQLTDHGVYEYNNNESPSSGSAQTASIAKQTAVVPEKESATVTEAISLFKNPIVVAPEDYKYSYTQSKADGSSTSVKGDEENVVTVVLNDEQNNVKPTEHSRGDIPEALA